MFLWTKTKPVGANCDAYMFNKQELVQKILMIIAISCIPLLLLGTPVYLYCTNKKKTQKPDVCYDLFTMFCIFLFSKQFNYLLLSWCQTLRDLKILTITTSLINKLVHMTNLIIT